MAAEPPSAGSPGQLALMLKGERERRGLSAEDIGCMANIATSHIERLESGDFLYLPPLYVFSYLKRYATELGVTDESLLESCRRALLFPETEPSASNTPSWPEQKRKNGGRNRRQLLLIFSLILLLLLAAVLLVRVF